MDAKLEELMKKLKEMEELLRRYCHMPNCTHINECPREHPQCKDMVGLHTAIAWMTADIIDRFVQHVQCGYDPQEYPKPLIDGIYTLKGVVNLDGRNMHLAECLGKARQMITSVLNDK